MLIPFLYRFNIQLTTRHIPGCLNVKADYLSRMGRLHTEWQLRPDVASEIIAMFGCTVDLFATAVNAQMPRFVTWRCETGSVGTDAFSLSWRKETPYIFPPVTLLPEILL